MAVTPQDVYSASNIQQATTNPAPKPNLSDPMGIYDFYMNSPDIQAAKGEVSSLQQQILGANQTLRNTLNSYENQTMNMNAIRGAQDQATRAMALPLQALSENFNAAQSRLSALISDAQNRFNISNSQREQLQQLILQNPGAKISFTDDIQTAAKKAEKYQQKQAEKNLLKELYANTFGTLPSKLSSNEIKKKLKKAFKDEKAYKDAIRDIELQSSKLALKKQQEAMGGGMGGEDIIAAIQRAFGDNPVNQPAQPAYLAEGGMSIDPARMVDYGRYLQPQQSSSSSSSSSSKPKSPYTAPGVYSGTSIGGKVQYIGG